MKPTIYRGHHIERISHSGMYSCFIAGHGYLKADNLEGIKELIDKADSLPDYDPVDFFE